jgi:hypothetical protein
LLKVNGEEGRTLYWDLLEKKEKKMILRVFKKNYFDIIVEPKTKM